MKVTIKDIAKKANVSTTTISRYINGNYKSMSEETKNRIDIIVNELEYKPNIIARSLKNNDSKIIGCIISDIDNKFSSSIFKGISRVCKEKGYKLLVTEIDNDSENEKEAIETLLSYNIKGLIINTTGTNDEYLLGLKEQIPIVLADRLISKKNEIDTVTSNNYESIYNLVKYLKEEGYDDIAFFTYETKFNTVRIIRQQAYVDAMNNFFNKNSNIYISNNVTRTCNNITKFLSTNKNNKKAIISVNGDFLTMLLKSFKLLNIDYEKENIGLASYDEWDKEEFIGSGITTIFQDTLKCGMICANLLIDRINCDNNKNVEYVEIKTKLNVRGSTKINKK